jgi:hypothetical protein
MCTGGVALAGSLIRWSPNKWPSVYREIPVFADTMFWTTNKPSKMNTVYYIYFTGDLHNTPYCVLMFTQLLLWKVLFAGIWRLPTFRRGILPQFWNSKGKARNRQEGPDLLTTSFNCGFLFNLSFEPEDGGNMFFLNVGSLLSNYISARMSSLMPCFNILEHSEDKTRFLWTYRITLKLKLSPS